MPARKIPLNYRNITGRIQSDKSDNYTQYESSLERDALILAEFDPEVVKYKSQPRTFYYLLNGKERKYTPDIYIKYLDGRELYVEVKYREDMKKNWSSLKPKFLAAIRELKPEPFAKFKIWTEVEIRTTYLENTRFLLPYQNKPLDTQQSCMILQVLDRVGELTPKELIAICSKNERLQSEFLYSLWASIARGFVKVDMLKPLTMNSPIWLGDVYQSEDTKWQWTKAANHQV